MTPTQRAAYWKRIGYQGDEKPTIENLRTLQNLHLTHVPYENLDIIAGKRLSLAPKDLYEKIVLHNRGGYCFELNALFAQLLLSMGYTITSCFARFLLGEKEIPLRRHQVLVVQAEGEKYLADVGVGVLIPRYSVKLTAGEIHREPLGEYKLTKDAQLGWILWDTRQGVWRKLFCFTEEPNLPVDYVTTSYFCEYAPESPFNKADMLAIGTPTGRITIDGDVLKHFDGDSVQTRTLTTPQEKTDALKEYFGIEL